MLAALRRAGAPYELSPGKLLRETLVTSGTMTNRVDRLVARGYVERNPDPDDRRGVLVRLTPEGKAAVAAHFAMHDDKLSRRTLQSIAFGLGGIIIISVASKPWEPVGLRELLGIGILLTGSVVSAAGNIVIAKKRGSLPAIELNCIQMLIGGAVLFLIALPIDGTPNLNLPARFYGALLWIAFVSAAGFGIWFHLLSRVKVSQLNIWKFLIPLAGATLSWLLIPNESPDLPTLAGMVLIVMGIIHSQRKTTDGEKTS